MARFDRCLICDYTEAEGSPLLGVLPGKYGKVRRFGADMMCETCSTIVDQNAFDIRPPNETDDALEKLED